MHVAIKLDGKGLFAGAQITMYATRFVPEYPHLVCVQSIVGGQEFCSLNDGLLGAWRGSPHGYTIPPASRVLLIALRDKLFAQGKVSL